MDDTQTFLSIFEGNVLAANEAGELNLTSGQSAVAEKGKAPVLRVVARPRDAVQWALYYPPVIYDAPAGLIDQSPESITDPRLLAQQAALLLNVGRIEEASADLDRALRIDPNFSDALALQAIVAIVQNDKDKALRSGPEGRGCRSELRNGSYFSLLRSAGALRPGKRPYHAPEGR